MNKKTDLTTNNSCIKLTSHKKAVSQCNLLASSQSLAQNKLLLNSTFSRNNYKYLQGHHPLIPLNQQKICKNNKIDSLLLRIQGKGSKEIHSQLIEQMLPSLPDKNYYFERIKVILQQGKDPLLELMCLEALNQIYNLVTYKQFIPPEIHKCNFSSLKKYIIAIDLDETLIHSEEKQQNKKYDYQNENFGTFVRPYCQYFLQELSRKADLFIYTAASLKYATTMKKIIDPTNQYFQSVYFRNHCLSFQNQIQVKDLTVVSNNLNTTILIDNNPLSFIAQPYNGIPIAPFIDSQDDTELLVLLKFIENQIFQTDNVQTVIKRHFQFEMFRQFQDGVSAFRVLYC